MRDGIVITGMGVVTPVGIGVDTYWENLTAGVCGIGEITQIDTTALPIHQRALEVDDQRGDEIARCLAAAENRHIIFLRHLEALRRRLEAARENECRAHIGQEMVENDAALFA